MGRPKEAIKAQLISGTDRYRVIFIEHPEWYFNTRFIDSEVAKQWGRRQGDAVRRKAEGYPFLSSPWRKLL
jgi:hypothetical protein